MPISACLLRAIRFYRFYTRLTAPDYPRPHYPHPLDSTPLPKSDKNSPIPVRKRYETAPSPMPTHHQNQTKPGEICLIPIKGSPYQNQTESAPIPTQPLLSRNQTEMTSPNHYTEKHSAQPDDETATKCPRWDPVNVDKQRQHHHITTLRTPQRSQVTKRPPNSHTESLSA